MRNRVVLPEPLGPTRPIFSPRWSAAEASMKRRWWPFCLLMLSRRIMDSGEGRWGGNKNCGAPLNPYRGRAEGPSGAFVQRREPVGFGNILDRIRIEERIDRRDRPGHGGERIARGPAVDFADVLLDQRMTQLIPQMHGPQADHGMRLAVGGGHRKLGAFLFACGLQPRHQVAR